VAAPRPSASSGPVAGVLPSTGSPAFLTGITLAGLAALLSGAALLVRRRRQLGGSTG
jgi:LPXTG-motif cell wall-anchored protein